MTDRRAYSPNPSERLRNTRFRCCVRPCRRLIAVTGRGWPMPVCVAHAAMLTPALFDELDAIADGSPFHPAAVLEAALLVKKVQARCAQVARRGKAKRNHA